MVGSRPSDAEGEDCVNIDELSGRQLDLAVARLMFGAEVEEHPNLRTGEMDAVYSPSLRSSNSTWVRVPSYSRTPKASIQVEVELQKRGWKRKQAPGGSPGDEQGNVPVVLQHADGRIVESFDR
jgi:hypothetical protein